jgi:hypothetical protein
MRAAARPGKRKEISTVVRKPLASKTLGAFLAMLPTSYALKNRVLLHHIAQVGFLTIVQEACKPETDEEM